jgi:hypothetical protein
MGSFVSGSTTRGCATPGLPSITLWYWFAAIRDEELFSDQNLQWELVGVAQETGSLDELRGVLGNAIAMKACREGTPPFPDGTILAKLAWKHVPSPEADGPFIRGHPTTVQIMVKDSRKCTSTGGWGFGRFIDGKPVDEASTKPASPAMRPKRAFNNEYWPARYFVDEQGRIRHHQFGEGEYEQSELIIQQLLAEARLSGISHELVSVDAQGAEVGADWSDLRSTENYVGYERTESFASVGSAKPERRHDYALPGRLKLNHWALSGDWTMEKEGIGLNKANGHIVYSFHSRDLHLVMAPAVPGTPVRFRVLMDGQPGAAHGVDVDDRGYGTVVEPRMLSADPTTDAHP